MTKIREHVEWSGLRKQLQKMQKEAVVHGKEAVMHIGYRAPYAIYVHEKVEMKWKGIPRHSGIYRYWSARGGRQGTAKFLTKPTRQRKVQRALSELIKKEMKDGASFTRAITVAAIRLRQFSRYVVPYEWGPLHESAYAMNPVTGREYA